MNKNELIKELLSELSYRSNEGYPMLDNREQISILAEILDEWGYTKIKNELIENLLEADDKKFTATKKDTNQTVAFDSEEARDAAIEKGTHTKKEDSEEDDSKKMKKDMFSSEAGYEAPDLKKDDDIDTTPKSKNSKLKKLPKEESIKIDHNSADKSLMMTKTEAKAQAQRTKAGETQNVGAGTPESRAGEAMVHKGLRLLQSGKSLEEIEEEFSKIVNSDDHILNSKTGKKWVSSTLSSLKKIDEVIGIENIQDVK